MCLIFVSDHLNDDYVNTGVTERIVSLSIEYLLNYIHIKKN